MEINTFLTKLNKQTDGVDFADTMAVIDANYRFTPTAFQNGNLQNSAGENSGSCKLFAFASLQGLSERQTLTCFGDYYHKEVVLNPEGDNHQNIRNFMKTGWQGIHFDGKPLTSLA